MLSSNSVYPSRNATLRKLKNAFSSSVLNTSESSPDFKKDSSSQPKPTPSTTFKQPCSDFTYGLYSVVLSDSIRSLDYLSPGLYHWIQSGDYCPKGYLRFYSPSGLLVKDSLPKHLTEPFTPESIPVSSSLPSPFPSHRHGVTMEEQQFHVHSISAESMRKQSRKPVMVDSTKSMAMLPTPSLDPPKIKRFFLNGKSILQMMELELNKVISNVEQVICIVTMSKQKRTTSCLPLGKSVNASKASSVSALCMESFIFDVPRGQGDIIISILVYSKSQEQNGYKPGGMVVSPSLSSLSSTSGQVMNSINFLSNPLKRSGTLTASVNHILNFDRERVQAEAGDIGIFLADLTVVVPSAHAFGKIDGWHPLTVNKKNIGRVQLQMGLFADYEYTPMPDVPREFAENQDHVNFYLLTRGGLIWDKKWVVASPDGLFVYSTEHRQEKQALAWIPFKQLIGVSRAQFESMARPFTLALSITLPWKDDTNVFMPSTLSSKWKDEVVEGGILNNFVVGIYIAADTMEKMERWLAFLTCHINRHQKRHL